MRAMNWPLDKPLVHFSEQKADDLDISGFVSRRPYPGRKRLG